MVMVVGVEAMTTRSVGASETETHWNIQATHVGKHKKEQLMAKEPHWWPVCPSGAGSPDCCSLRTRESDTLSLVPAQLK